MLEIWLESWIQHVSIDILYDTITFLKHVQTSEFVTVIFGYLADSDKTWFMSLLDDISNVNNILTMALVTLLSVEFDYIKVEHNLSMCSIARF